MNPTENQQEKYHHLVAGQIVLTQGDDPALNTVFLNGVITTQDCIIGAHDIGRAQQTLQMLFFKRIPPEAHSELKIVDVVIMNMMNLGYMTDERFLKKPDGVEVKKRAKAALKVVVSNDAPADPHADLLN